MENSLPLCMEKECSAIQSLVFIPKEIEFWLARIIYVSVLFIAAFLGVPGNVLSALVFYRQGLRERINLCLFAHAVVDLSVDVVFLIEYSERLHSLLDKTTIVIAQIVHSLSGTVWASQFLSAVIASERCFCVVSPFHAKRLLKTSTMAAIIVVCCILLVTGMAATLGPKYTSGSWTDPETNSTVGFMYLSRYYLDNRALLDTIDIYVYTIAISGSFLIVVIVTTTLTIVKLRAALVWRQKAAFAATRTSGINTASGENQNNAVTCNKELSVTLMQIVASVLFVVHVAPNLILQLCNGIVSELTPTGKYRNVSNFIWHVIVLLWTVNSSLNFFVYYKMGTKFRESLKALFTRKKINALNLVSSSGLRQPEECEL